MSDRQEYFYTDTKLSIHLHRPGGLFELCETATYRSKACTLCEQSGGKAGVFPHQYSGRNTA